MTDVYLFVDVDGVLNSKRFYMRAYGVDGGGDLDPRMPHLRLDPTAVARLHVLANALDAKLVFSSNWRRSMSYSAFADLCERVAGVRPNFIDQTVVLGSPIGPVRRREILSFVSDLSRANKGGGVLYVALDDMELGIDEHHWVNPDRGLVEDDVLTIIERVRRLK